MNSTRKFQFKWGKESFTLDVEAYTIADLKKEIHNKLNIEPDRQKILMKGKNLEDSCSTNSIPDGVTLTVMGQPSTNTVDLSKKIVFLEDLSPEEKAKMLREKGEEVVFGLQNLGNTCYFNSTLQALGRVPELRKALQEKAGSSTNSNLLGNDLGFAFVKALGQTFYNLDNAHDTIVPNNAIQVLRTMNPMFAEQDKGYFKQQDADECFSLMLNTIRDYVPNTSKEEQFSKNLIEELFGIEMEINLKNVEEPSEVKASKEILFKLTCYISNQTNELVEGLKNSMKENLELYSNVLGRNTFFLKSQLINRLPPYLTVQFMRFDWKKENVSTGAKGGKTKILKSVIFSKVIDLYDMCTDSTKEILNLGRNIETKMLKDDKNFRIENVESKPGEEMISTGRYKLIAVVTHQGRSSESGHYIGWVHKKDDKWIKFDDDKVSIVNINEILELKGGGDWHMAYICIYKRLEVPFRDIGE